MDNKVRDLTRIAYEIRYHALEGIFNAKSGHPGGSFSIAELVSVLYFDEMNIDVKNPKMESRDRFVLSKGQTAPALYGALGLAGFFDIGDLKNLRRINSNLQGHPDMNKLAGVDMSTGSLGQGYSAATGMALCAKAEGNEYRVYTILGDGEIQEGQVWEASMAAGHYKLDNLCVIVDNNGFQSDGAVEDVMNIHPIGEKFRAFGFHTIEINGNDVAQILEALKIARETKGKPTCIIAKTMKGYGIKEIEGNAYHGAPPSAELYDKAREELKNKINSLGGNL